jgi:hypothetical protein
MVRPLRRLALIACLAALAAGAAACGGDDQQGLEQEGAAREGLALDLEGLDYNVFITRQLNPEVPPDEAYYTGPEPAPGQTLYGVFLQVCNNSDEPHESADSFVIKDSQENEFEPEEPEEDTQNFRYEAAVINPDQCIPEAGSVAQLGPSAATMLLFRLPLENTENRPLELEIEGEEESLTFELDI